MPSEAPPSSTTSETEEDKLVSFVPAQGRGRLASGVVVFDDGGQMSPDGLVVPGVRAGDLVRAVAPATPGCFARVQATAPEPTVEQLAVLKGAPADHDRLADWLAVPEAPADPWANPTLCVEIDGEGRFEVVRLLTPVALAAIARLLAAGDPVGPVLATTPRNCLELLCEPGAARGLALYGVVYSARSVGCPRPGRTARGRYWLSVPPDPRLTRPADLVKAILKDAPVPAGGAR